MVLKTLLFIMLFSSPAFAHADRIITMDNHGNLKGLPVEYLPASIDIKKLIIYIGNNQLQLNKCMKPIFHSNDIYDLNITSSWYHPTMNDNLIKLKKLRETYNEGEAIENLPPYITFNFTPNNKDYTIKLFLNLDNLKAISPHSIEIHSTKYKSTKNAIRDKKCVNIMNTTTAY